MIRSLATCYQKAMSLLGSLSNCGQTWMSRTQAACLASQGISVG